MERVSKDRGYENGMTTDQRGDQHDTQCDGWRVDQRNDRSEQAGIDYQAYCTQACSALKKATQKEKSSLSEELLDHMESHAEALIELGWDPEEARTYSVQAMGDPETVGRQYDEKLSSFWLWCGRVLRVLLIVLLVWIGGVPAIGKGISVYYNLQARWFFDPDRALSSTSGEQILKQQDLDIEIPLEHDVFRIYRTEIYYDVQIDSYVVCVYALNYAKNPFEYRGTLIELVEPDNDYGGGGFFSSGVAYYNWHSRVIQGQPSVGLNFEREETDTHFRVEIPLDWEGIS